MGSYVEEVGIRMRADGVIETGSGIALTGKSLDDLQKKAASAGKGMDGFTVSARQTQNAMRQLPAQITDVVTSLASGQKPWMVAIQQGGQIKDSFGGIVPAARALIGVMGPLGLALAAVGAVAGSMGLAMYNGWQQSRELNNALALTGNTAGITEGTFNGMVQSFASAANGAGKARDMLQAVVASGEATGSTLNAIAAGALALSRVNGQSAADSVKAFNGMSDGVTAWAAKANRSYNYLTAEQYRQIMALETQGRSSEAVRLNMEALTTTLQSRTTPQLGYLESAIKSATGWWNSFWDAASGAGRPQQTEDRLREITALLADKNFGNIYGGGRRALEVEQRQLQAELARKAGRESDAAAEREAEKDRIYKAGREYTDTVLAERAAKGQKAQAQDLNSLQARLNATERAYRQFEISGATYRDRIIAIERGRVMVEEELAEKSLQIERERVTKNQAEGNQKAAAILAAEARVIAIKTQRLTLEQRIAAGELDPKGRELVDTPREAFRRSEIENGRAGTDALQQRLNDSKNAAHELLATNKTLSAELIQDERKRAEALLAIDVQQMRDRLLLNVGSVEERQAKEDAFAQWMVLRQRKLNQDLRPEWERLLDQWRDTQGMMKEASDNTFTAFLRGGEDAFVQLVTTGKISASSLVNTWLSEIARVQWRKLMTGQFSMGDIGSSIGGAISGVGRAIGTIGGWLGFGHHGGGMAGAEPSFTRAMPASTWAGAPRLHGGGLADDEVPAILRKGEGVFTQGQMRQLAPVDQLAAAARPSVTYAPTFNVDSRADRADLLAQMQRMTKASQNELLEMMSRGMA